MATRTTYDAVANSVLTAANLDTLSKGWIGYVESTATQSGISAETDVTGMSVTVTILGSRYHKLTGTVQVQGSADTVFCRLFAYRASTVIGRSQHRMHTAQQTMHVHAVIASLAAGSYTFKMAVVPTVGAGTLETSAGTGLENFLLIEDVGSSS